MVRFCVGLLGRNPWVLRKTFFSCNLANPKAAYRLASLNMVTIILRSSLSPLRKVIIWNSLVIQLILLDKASNWHLNSSIVVVYLSFVKAPIGDEGPKCTFKTITNPYQIQIGLESISQQYKERALPFIRKMIIQSITVRKKLLGLKNPLREFRTIKLRKIQPKSSNLNFLIPFK